MKPGEAARELIDAKLTEAGWCVQPYAEMNLGAGPGLAVTEFPGSHGPADYLLYVDRKAIGVVEAKPVGHTLKGVEGQSATAANIAYRLLRHGYARRICFLVDRKNLGLQRLEELYGGTA